MIHSIRFFLFIHHDALVNYRNVIVNVALSDISKSTRHNILSTVFSFSHVWKFNNTICHYRIGLIQLTDYMYFLKGRHKHSKYTKSNYPLFRSEIIYLWRYSCANTDNYAKLSCFKVEWSLKLSTYTHFRVVFIHVYAKWQVDQNILQSQLGERIATVQFQFLEKMLNQMDVSFIASCLKDFFITIFRIWISCHKYIF